MHTHSGAHNYLFKYSTGYFFCIFSKSTVPMALQTMCHSTFGILQFKTMWAPPEQNTEEQREAFQPTALTYRKPLSHLAFATNRKAAVCECVCARTLACMFQFDCRSLPCLSMLIVFMHACVFADVNIFIYMGARCLCVCVCVFIGTYAWSRCNTSLYMVCVCAGVNYICVCLCVCLPHLSD